METSFDILLGDCRYLLNSIPEKSVNCCVTSPPYFGLRDYGVEGQTGLEKIPEDYVSSLVKIFEEVWRVMRDDGTLWLNLGDSYMSVKSYAYPPQTRGGQSGMPSDFIPPNRKSQKGLKTKDLIGIPWRVALALQANGWYLRQDIIWHKPNPMPESVKDRCTKSHEYLFLLSKQPKYYFDSDSIKEPAVCQPSLRHSVVKESNRKALRSDIESRHRSSIEGGQTLQKNPDGKRNRRSVWTVPTKPFKGAHFATFPPKLIEPCILAGCPKGGTVLDPFAGSGTTGEVSLLNGRNFIGIELNPDYHKMATDRLNNLNTK